MKHAEQPTKWTLSDLLPEPVDKALEDAFKKLEHAVVEFEALRDLLNENILPKDFNGVLEKIEFITLIKSIVEGYADLAFAENTQDSFILNVRDRVDQVLTDIGNRTLFFELWFKELSEEKINELIANSGERHYFLETMTRFKPYTLTEAEEQTINLKDVNGIDAIVNLYEMITNQFSFHLNIDGKKETLTRDELANYFSSPSPELRKSAYDELNRVYAENSTVLAQMYMHRVRDWHTEGLEMRGFASPISIRNLENDIPDNVVETLLDVCRRNTDIFQKYFKMKAQWLKLGKLRRYDIYAPLTPSEKKFDYAYAKKIVMESYQAFSPQMASLAQRVFDDNHIDSEVRTGKRGGAFCYTASPAFTPWVLMSYDGSARDIATLAHELGHAAHSMLAEHHSPLTQLPALPLAETASVFAEMQLTERLLAQEKDTAVRKDLLANALDDAYITVIRQAFFAIFERDAHQMIADNCTIDELTDKYMENLKEQFGDAVEVSDDFKWEWTAVPHFYASPFYTYAYSFGQLLVLALYQQYRVEGESFLPRYLKILSYGGSEAPAKVLEEAGLDIAAPEFWQGAFDVLEKMISDLEHLNEGATE